MSAIPEDIRQAADEAGRDAIYHLDQMYPQWKDVLPRSARSSLKNFIAMNIAGRLEDERLATEARVREECAKVAVAAAEAVGIGCDFRDSIAAAIRGQQP